VAERDPDPAEQLAKRLLSAVLGVQLEVWDTGCRQGAVDFHVVGRSIAIEVKRITSEEYRRAEAQWRQHTVPFASKVLTRSWHVVIELPEFESKGLQGPIDFRHLAKNIEPHLRQLEELGVDRVLHGADWLDLQLCGGPAGPLQELLGSGAGMHSYPVADSDSGGVIIAVSSGVVASSDVNSLVDLVDFFLGEGSSLGMNMRHKLAADGAAERHAFLVVDHIVPVWTMMRHWWAKQQLPTRLPNLPPEIDHVWLAGYGDLVWHCSREEPWRMASAPGGGTTD